MNGISQLQQFLHTDPADDGCERLFELIHVYVERELDYGDAAEHYPGIAAHLDACGPCAEDHRGLLSLITTS
jgi:hypothetical protein